MYNTFRFRTHVGHDETHSREKLALMPLYFGNYTTGSIPTGCLIDEITIPYNRILRRMSNWACQQMLNFLIEYFICREPYCIQKAFSFQVFINFWLCKCGITTEVSPYFLVLIPVNDRLYQLPPTVGTVNIARPKHRSFTIPELIEAEQRMKTGTSEMAIIC